MKAIFIKGDGGQGISGPPYGINVPVELVVVGLDSGGSLLRRCGSGAGLWRRGRIDQAGRGRRRGQTLLL